jgi:thioesterase domain-containing protein
VTEPLVTVQPGTAGPPVYCFHPQGGSAAVYGPLAARIGRDHLVYGLQSIGLLPGHDPDRTVAAMAHRYAGAVAAHRLDGAVLLGYSLGGVLALETARLLRERREEPRVVLVDCDPLYAPRPGSGPWQTLVRQVLNIDLPVEPLADLPVERALETVRTAGARQGRIPARMNLDRLARMLDVCQANEAAAADHVPLPFPGTVHVVRSAGASPDGDVWDAFADRTVVSVVDVDHHDIVDRRGVPAVADVVRSLLRPALDAHGR